MFEIDFTIKKKDIKHHKFFQGFFELKTSTKIFFQVETKKFMASTAACECGDKKSTAEHVITTCPIYYHSNGVRSLSDVDKS